MTKTYSSPFFSIVVAIAENYVIGKDNQLPWHLPADLKHFKAITIGHPILMGRKTYEAIGKPLPDRQNIILTREVSFHAPQCIIVTSLAEIYTLAQEHKMDEIFIIGGAEIYRQFLPQTKRIYLTIVHHEFEGDTYFPIIEWNEWTKVSEESHEADSKNPYAYSFMVLEKKIL